MKIYKGTLKKKNGEVRDMVFAKIHDIIQVNEEFIAAKIVGTGSSRNYKPYQELVWDLEADDFRIFNWEKASNISEKYVSDDLFKRKVNV